MIFIAHIPSSSFRFRLLRLSIRHRVIFIELQADAIHAMPLVRRRIVTLPLEHMSQVSATVGADDLRPGHPEGAVCMPRHGAGDVVVVGGPAAAGLEFVVRGVEWRVARSAGVDTGLGHVFVILAGEGSFGAFFADDAELLFVENCLPFVIGLLDGIRHVFG